MKKKCEHCKTKEVESKTRDVCKDCINIVLIQGGRKDLIIK